MYTYMYKAGFELQDRGDILEAIQDARQDNEGKDKTIRRVGEGGNEKSA